MHALNNKCFAVPPAERWSRLLLHVQAGRTYQRGKSAAYCLDRVRGLGTKSSLLHCCKEECRQGVGDLKEVFTIGSYVCSDCSNIVEEYPKRRVRCQYAEHLLSNTVTISSQSARSPAQARPSFPLAMSCHHQSC